MAGEHVYLHIVSPDGSEPTRFVDALVLHSYSDRPDVPDHLLDVVFYNHDKRGTGVIDKLDFRLGLKHKNHEDIEKGKELFYYTWPPVVSSDAEPVEPQIQLASEPLTDEQVYEDVAIKLRNGETYEGTNGANLAQVFKAFNRYSVELRSEIESMQRVRVTEEQALDNALQHIHAQQAPAPAIETREYLDGTTATGVAPLPEQSPVENTESEAPAPQEASTDNTGDVPTPQAVTEAPEEQAETVAQA